MLTIDTLLPQLEDVTQKGDRWMARCPAHEDNTPSLSVAVGDEGKLLLKCFAGCSFDSIVSSLNTNGVNGNGTGTAKIKTAKKKKPKAPPPWERTPIAKYPYIDQSGNLLYEKYRFWEKRNGEIYGDGYDPKYIIRRHGRMSRDDKWGIGDAPRLLYNLPLLLDEKRKEEPIYIVEGEKDADRLVALGLIATCNFDGASEENQKTKWHGDEYNQFFTGRRVVIFPDNDKPGEIHAKTIADQLAQIGENNEPPIATEVKIVNLPDLPEHGDISNWLDIGTKEKLLQLVDQTERHVVKPRMIGDHAVTQDYFNALQALGYFFRLNTLDNSIEVNGQPIDDGLEARMRNQMRDWRLGTVGRITDAYIDLAFRNKYDPLVDYLTRLKWDGNDHLGQLMNYIDETTQFGHVAIKRWLIGSVARIMEDAQNFMLVMDGPQEIGKSSFVKWICPLPDYWIEGPIKADDKDYMLRMATKWIWEVGELQSTTRRNDREALKGLLTMERVTARKAYGRHDITKPVKASFFGTINEDGAGFLSDPTGNRRFVIINVKKINHLYTEHINLDQIWAQVVALYKSGEPWRLTKEEAAVRDAINEEYMMNNIVEIYFYDNFIIDPESPLYITTHDILETLRLDGLTGSQHAILAEVSRILTKAGAIQFRARVGGGRPMAWRGVYRIEESDEPKKVNDPNDPKRS